MAAARPVFPRSVLARPADAPRRVRIVCWNLASIRAATSRSRDALLGALRALNADVVFFSETKLQEHGVAEYRELLGRDFSASHFSCSVAKKGYAGTALFCRAGLPVQRVSFGLEDDARDPGEGRSITLELPDFFFVGLYVVNSGEGLKRLDYRVNAWDPAVRDYLARLSARKPVVLGGDLNVAPEDADVWNAAAKHIPKQAGCTKEERDSFRALLASQSRVDAFRALYPEATGWFSYWSTRAGNRPVNRGLRLDGFVAPAALLDRAARVHVRDSWIHDAPGTDAVSDHAPVVCDVVAPASWVP